MTVFWFYPNIHKPSGYDETILPCLMYKLPCFWMKCFGVLNGVMKRTVVPQEKHFVKKKIKLLGTPLSQPHMYQHLCLCSLLCQLSLWMWTVSFLKSPSPLGHKILSPSTHLPIKEHHSSCFLLSLARWIKASSLHHPP